MLIKVFEIMQLKLMQIEGKIITSQILRKLTQNTGAKISK